MAPGTRCAEVLLALDLPVELVVRTVMEEIDLTHDEATRAVREAGASCR
jgi:hypothetical protein